MLDLTPAITYLQQHVPSLLAISVFGSQAQHTATQSSDLDLAILMAGKMDTLQLWQLSTELAKQFHMDVDLLDLRAASTVMQYQIIMQGQCLWQQDAQGDLYECFILREKLELDAGRAGLLEDIQARGSVYGQ